MGLSFNINCDPGLEFHDEVVCEDGNLLNELFNQSLIKRKRQIILRIF